MRHRGIHIGNTVQGRKSGNVYIIRDIQKRLYTEDGTIGWDGGNETTTPGMGGWVVLVHGDGSLSGDSLSVGLFWRKEDAELFATQYCLIHGLTRGVSE